MLKSLWRLGAGLVLCFTFAAGTRADFSDGGAAGVPRDASSLQTTATDAPHKRIEVNLSTQHLIAWEGGQVVFAFAVTTGQADQPTIAGEYAILDKEVDAYSYGWGLSLPYWLGVYQFGDLENGFHALPLTPDGEELWGDALGNFPASHGCIVLSSADAQKLFEWAEVGTAVVIHD